LEIKSGLFQKYNADKEEEAHQKKLRERYNVSNEEVKVVEKPMAWKFVVKLIGQIFRLLANIILLLLALIGIVALLYPESREVLWSFLMTSIGQTQLDISQVSSLLP